MFIVVLGTFSWSSLRIIRKVPLSDALIMVLVSGVTVATNLAIAVVVGVIVSALVFAWNAARSIYVIAEDADAERAAEQQDEHRARGGGRRGRGRR